jgi:Holliday junction resolvase
VLLVPTAKQRGVQFEYGCAYFFERFGYTWDRSGSSLGIDLKILKNGKLHYLINCKKTVKSKIIYLAQTEVERLSAEAAERGAKDLVCFGFYRSPICVFALNEVKKLERTKLNYKLKPEDGTPLEELLKRGR